MKKYYKKLKQLKIHYILYVLVAVSMLLLFLFLVESCAGIEFMPERKTPNDHINWYTKDGKRGHYVIYDDQQEIYFKK